MSWQVWINQRFEALRNGLGTRVGLDSAATLQGSKVFDWPSVATGAATSTTLTVTGAQIGDFCEASMSVAVAGGADLSAQVTAPDTVTVTLTNLTGGAVDLASGTLRAIVFVR